MFLRKRDQLVGVGATCPSDFWLPRWSHCVFIDHAFLFCLQRSANRWLHPHSLFLTPKKRNWTSLILQSASPRPGLNSWSQGPTRSQNGPKTQSPSRSIPQWCPLWCSPPQVLGLAHRPQRVQTWDPQQKLGPKGCSPAALSDFLGYHKLQFLILIVRIKMPFLGAHHVQTKPNEHLWRFLDQWITHFGSRKKKPLNSRPKFKHPVEKGVL